jgi:hypothetical protein
METVEIDQGIEKVAASTADPHLRRISPMSEGDTRPALSLMMSKAVEGGNIHWLRWETINGTRTAVFSFAVDKSKALYTVDYCCFPTYRDMDVEWKPYKKTVGMHGEFFIDPDTGTTLRMVTQAELSPTDYVEQEDTRIDYGKETIGGNMYSVPEGSITQIDLDAGGDSPKGKIMHRTFLVAGYSDYRLAGAAQK